MKTTPQELAQLQLAALDGDTVVPGALLSRVVADLEQMHRYERRAAALADDALVNEGSL